MIILSSTVVKERLTEQDVWGSILIKHFFFCCRFVMVAFFFSYIFFSLLEFPFFLLLALSLSFARLSKSHMSRIKLIMTLFTGSDEAALHVAV